MTENQKEKRQTVLVIGGGASGMMASIIAAENGAIVTLLEHTEKVGKKLLATGNGRCNLTNRYQKASCYFGTYKEFAWKVYQKFPVEKTIQFFKERGLHLKDRNGYIYPYSDQASTVRDLLIMELKRLKVSIKYEEEPKKIEKQKKGFCVITENGRHFYARSLILAAGSKASEKTGSDGSGYELAHDFGHRLVEPLPALVQLTCEGKIWKKIAGVRAQARITIKCDGIEWSEQGELQITSSGISGIPVFQLSRFCVRSLYEKREDTAPSVEGYLDFAPDLNINQVKEILRKQIEEYQRTWEEALSLLIHKKLAVCMTERIGGQNKENELKRLAEMVKQFPIQIIGHLSFDSGQVCQGGVSTEQIDPETMESKRVSGLYFAGEIVDVDGICGGYNLQWAWSSGYLAGKSAAVHSKQK